MTFTTLSFVVFFVIVFSLYLTFTERRQRHILLLASSSFFYAWWDYRFLALMWSVILIAYTAARLEQARPERAKTILTFALVLQLGLLSVFKYSGFVWQCAAGLADQLGWHVEATVVHLILPIGISFYIFHGISYIVDVYRGVIRAERSLMNVALYISYFPQLVAGPIVRAADFMPQLGRSVVLSQSTMATGVREFTTGLIYKSAFADSLGQLVDPVFDNIAVFNNYSLVWASAGFYAQIYFDFAGYSLMAIGLARIMGYNFPDNFKHPYQATSITDFWRRWHISLSTWLRNYLYFPLGGNRHGKVKQYRNLIITMLLGGLWHGASWNFVVWGGLHGFALAAHKFFGRGESQVQKSERLIPWVICSWILTQAFVLLCWIPFRLPDFSKTVEVFSAFVGLRADEGLRHASMNHWLLLLPLAVDTILPHCKFEVIQRAWARIPEQAQPCVRCFLVGLAFASVLTLIPGTVKPFIYFQF